MAGGGAVVPRTHRVLVAHAASRQTLVEEITVESSAPRFIYLRPVPAEAEVGTAPPQLFDALAEQTAVEEPHHQRVRQNPFGLSLASRLWEHLRAEPERAAPPELLPPEPRRLTLSDQATFSGRVESSTITPGLILPSELASWLEQRGVSLTEGEKLAAATFLNRGWSLVALEVTDPAPTSTRPARLGPLRFTFRTQVPLLAMLPSDRNPPAPVSLELYALGAAPLVGSAWPTVWNREPWRKSALAANTMRVVYQQPVAPLSPLAFTLSAAVPFPEEAALVRGEMRSTVPGAPVEAHLTPARGALPIPGSGSRGTAFDVWLVLLLGAAPLVLAPESWLLLWLTGRARAQARKAGKALGTHLWSYYAVAVGAFWLLTLEGTARLAAVIPALLGAARLALPYTEREVPRVRVQFSKKRRKAAAA